MFTRVAAKRRDRGLDRVHPVAGRAHQERSRTRGRATDCGGCGTSRAPTRPGLTVARSTVPGSVDSIDALMRMAPGFDYGAPPDREPWRKRARCRGVGVHAFFDARASGIEMCERCPVRVECGTYATDNGLVGVWGGRRHRWRGRFIFSVDGSEPAPRTTRRDG